MFKFGFLIRLLNKVFNLLWHFNISRCGLIIYEYLIKFSHKRSKE